MLAFSYFGCPERLVAVVRAAVGLRANLLAFSEIRNNSFDGFKDGTNLPYTVPNGHQHVSPVDIPVVSIKSVI
jgi:hypothetical protein